MGLFGPNFIKLGVKIFMTYLKYTSLVLGLAVSVLKGANSTDKLMIDKLIRASELGNLADIQAVLASAPGLDLNTSNRYGQTALHKAVWFRHNAVIDFLISKGADVNQRTPAGTTILMETAIMGDRRTVMLLLARGADADLVDSEGNTAAMLAHLHSNPAIGNMIPTYARQIFAWKRREGFLAAVYQTTRALHGVQASAAASAAGESLE